jgi:hypothetical protein
MPVKNMQCATYQHYSITQAVFNISSDAVMFAIPIPLLVRAQLKRRRKFLLLGVMSLGLFTIVAAILNKYFNFASPLTTTYQIWYIREASTAIYVANLMCWWPLLRKIFGLKAFQYNSNRGRRARDPNGQNKDSNGLSQSGTSQSRPSFSLPQALRFVRPPCRRGANHNAANRHDRDPQRSSQEAITQVSVSNDYEEFHRVEAVDAVPLEEWNKDEDRAIDTEDDSHVSGAQSDKSRSKRDDLSEDRIYHAA